MLEGKEVEVEGQNCGRYHVHVEYVLYLLFTVGLLLIISARRSPFFSVIETRGGTERGQGELPSPCDPVRVWSEV